MCFILTVQMLFMLSVTPVLFLQVRVDRRRGKGFAKAYIVLFVFSLRVYNTTAELDGLINVCLLWLAAQTKRGEVDLKPKDSNF